MTNYAHPQWDEPLDVDAYVNGMPPGALIKGLFPAALVAEAKRRNVVLKTAGEKYLPFLDYSLMDHNRMIVEAAKAFWPDAPVRLGLRRIGRAATQSLLLTTFGKATLGGLTQPESVGRALVGLARTYATTLTKPTPVVELIETGERSAILRLRDAWIFPDCQQVGIIEGLCRACGTHGDVRVAAEGPASAEFSCTWEAAPPSRPSNP